MNTRVVLRAKARTNISQAFSTYSDASPELATQFLNAVQNRLEELKEFPLSSVKVHRNIRRAVLSHHPYALFYSVEEYRNERRIVILACLHQKRNPQEWQNLA